MVALADVPWLPTFCCQWCIGLSRAVLPLQLDCPKSNLTYIGRLSSLWLQL